MRDILLHERRINERIIKVGLSRIDPGGNLDPLKFLVLNFETEKTEIYKIQIGAWIKKDTSSGGDSISPGLHYPEHAKSFNGVNECKAEKIGLIVEQVDSTSGEVIKKRWGIRNVEVEF